MDYGGYVVITILVLAAVFFALALYNRGNIKTLIFTSYALAALCVAGFISYYSSPSRDLQISLFLLVVLPAIYLWFYRGSARDERKE